MAIQGLNCFLT